MRSPNPNGGNPNNVYNVTPTGTLDNNNAYNSNGVAPDCVLSSDEYAEAESSEFTQGGSYPARKGETKPPTSATLMAALNAAAVEF
jgi:hypothetical protein